MKRYLEFINERNLGSIEKNLVIKLNIDSTVHSDERQSRHGDYSSREYIDDTDIIRAIRKATPTIGDSLLKDYIFIGDEIHIFNKEENLNIIGTIQRSKSDGLEFKVITVMIKSNFKPYTKTKTIEV